MDQDELDAIAELKLMSPEELGKVHHTIVKWVCQCKGCDRGTSIWDFGIEPEYYHPRKSLGWFDINYNYWMCSVHYPFIKKLKKNFTDEHIRTRLMDFTKQILIIKQ